jgi:hypothetical protein
MTAAPESDLSPLFAPDPWERWNAARQFAPERAERVIAEMKRGGAEFSKADLDMRIGFPEHLRPSVAGWGEHLRLWGAANAWIVFVGPSPSGSDRAMGKRHELLSAMHEEGDHPTIGWPHPNYWYSNDDKFILYLRAWARETLAGTGHELLSNLVEKPLQRAD